MILRAVDLLYTAVWIHFCLCWYIICF